MAFPSTFLSLQDEIMDELRLEDGDRDAVKDWINQAYAQAALEVELYQEYATATLTADTSVYGLSDTLARIKWIKARSAAAGSEFGPFLQRIPHETMAELASSWDTAANAGETVACYSVWGKNRIEFFPTPADADTVLIYYVKLPVALAADGNVPDMPEPYGTRCLKYGALFEAANFTKDPGASDYRFLFEDAIRRLRVHLHRRGGGGVQQFRVPGRSTVSVPPDVDRGD